MLTKLVELSANTYQAELYALNPKGYRPPESGNENHKSRYQAELKKILPDGAADKPEAELPVLRKNQLNDYGLNQLTVCFCWI